MAIYMPTEIRGNIAIIQGVPWAFGRFHTFSYDGLSVEEKLQKIREAQSIFKDVIVPDLTGSIWLVQKEQSWSTELENVTETSPTENQKELAQLTDSWLETIQQEGAQSQYEFIFAIELPVGDAFKQTVLSRYNPFSSDSVQRWLRKIISTSLDDQNMERFQRVFREQTANISVSELTTVEIMDFYQKHNYRGLKRPILAHQEYPENLNFLMPNPVEDHGKYIRIDHTEGERYLTFITVALYPSQIATPGYDLLYDLQSQGLPVEVQLWWRQKSFKDAKAFAERKKKAASANSQHVGEVQSITLMDEKTEAKAEFFEEEIHSKSSPLNKVHLVFCLTAEYGEEELEYYVKILEGYLEKKGITPHRSTSDQGAYYDAWVPQAKWSPIGFEFSMLPDRTGAIAIPGASDQLGDPTGLPKGMLLTNGSIVRLNFSWGARVDSTSNIVIVGQAGSGKTHLADDLVRDTLLTTHSRGIYVDVKGEHDQWHNAPGLEGKVQYKFLDGYDNPGILDPFSLIQHMDDEELRENDQEKQRLARAREIAYDMILQILDISNDQQSFARRNDILQALDAVSKINDPSMSKVIDMLKKSSREEAREMGFYLERVKELPLGKLIFGEAKEENRLQFPKTGLIILGIKNITLPEDGKSSVSHSERLSESCMIGISVMVEQFLIEGKQKGVFSFFVGDEGHFYMRSNAGKYQIERNFRLGRSAFCGNIICTQNPDDIPESLLNHVSVYICLGTKTDQQTTKAMQALGVSLENEEVFQELKRLGIEQSLQSLRGKLGERQFSIGYVRDLAQRVGLVKFITPQKHVREFLKTRPDLLETHTNQDDDSSSERGVIHV
ncbi:ATP-binding protein [Shimazuella kribbensis]|uniref:ATP-binding protein n=1 Tax=Shimazuella kribbensis TaxID=139808 RepID=UPI000414E74A|nr:ATP-binding protein [Shimazuella kribbensis]